MRLLALLPVLCLASIGPATANAQTATTAAHIQRTLEPVSPLASHALAPRPDLAHGLALSLPAQEPRGSVEASAGLGLVLGAVGFVGGGLAVAKLAEPDHGDDGFRALESAFYGAAAFGTAGLALGVHLGNARQGNYALDVLTAGGVWAAGYSLARADGFDSSLSTVVFVLIPVMQLVASISVERAEGRARAPDQESALSVQLGPDGHGGLTLGMSARF